LLGSANNRVRVKRPILLAKVVALAADDEVGAVDVAVPDSVHCQAGSA
jgi:hypothetical protein